MSHFIENKNLKIQVENTGAELVSLYSKEADTEYLWYGKKEIWGKHAPILFPIVGKLIDDKYRVNGKEYTLEKHGFARNTEFKLIDKGEDFIKFCLTENEETLKKYPYKFNLIITYTLKGKTLEVTHEVVNTNDDTMYFSLGGHPAFNCEIGDILEFEKEETLAAEKIHIENALLLPNKFPLLDNEKEIVITKDIFAEDALILSGFKSDYVTLKSPNHDRTVKVTLGGAPYLGIWAKPGAPYVCIEPWFGVNDSPEVKNDISEKNQIVKLEKGKTFTFTWTATVSH